MGAKGVQGNWAAVLLLAIITAISLSATPNAAEDFVKVSLPHNVSIELAKTWVVLSGTQRIALHSFSEKVLDLSRIEKPISELSFAANCLDERGDVIGIMNIRYYPQLELTQYDARNATEKEIKKIDAGLREAMVKSSKAFGMHVSSWVGTQKVNINGITALLSEYRRASEEGTGEFRVRLARVLAGPRSFTLTVSYRVAASHHLLPATDRIINSMRIEGITQPSYGLPEGFTLDEPKTNFTPEEKPKPGIVKDHEFDWDTLAREQGLTKEPEKPALTSGRAGSGAPSIMSELYGEQWGLGLVISLFLTWAIGLTPPLLIRFVFMRRPMTRRWAIPVVLLFYFFNFWLFISVLGSENKKHYAIALIAMISYGILRRGAKVVITDDPSLLLPPHSAEGL